jgi:Flp pilus assembly protein TadD
MTIERARAWRGTTTKRWPPAWWSIARVACLLAGVLMTAGCMVMPPQPAATAPASPSAPQTPIGSLPPDQLQGVAKETEFHATATDRQRFQVRIDFGRVFESQGNLDAAVIEYQEALNVAATRRRGSLGPADEAVAHRRMGGALDRMGRFAQAETHYKKALALSPKDSKIWNDAGYSYYLQGRWADAERALQQAAVLAPEDNRIRTNLGLTMAAAGRANEALLLLSQSNGDAVGHANLGYLLAAAGQFDLARVQYETALAMRPDLELPRRALARIDLQQQQRQAPPTAPAIAAELVPLPPNPVEAGVKPVSLPRVNVPVAVPSAGPGATAGASAQLVLPSAQAGNTIVTPAPAARQQVAAPPPSGGQSAFRPQPVAAEPVRQAARPVDTSVKPASAPRVNQLPRAPGGGQRPVVPPPATVPKVQPKSYPRKPDVKPASAPRVQVSPPVPSASRPPGTLSTAISQGARPAAHTVDTSVKPASAPRVQIPPPVPTGSRTPGTFSTAISQGARPEAHTLDTSVKPASAPRVQIPPPAPKRLLPAPGAGAAAGSRTLSAEPGSPEVFTSSLPASR